MLSATLAKARAPPCSSPATSATRIRESRNPRRSREDEPDRSGHDPYSSRARARWPNSSVQSRTAARFSPRRTARCASPARARATCIGGGDWAHGPHRARLHPRAAQRREQPGAKSATRSPCVRGSTSSNRSAAICALGCATAPAALDAPEPARRARSTSVPGADSNRTVGELVHRNPAPLAGRPLAGLHGPEPNAAAECRAARNFPSRRPGPTF